MRMDDMPVGLRPGVKFVLGWFDWKHSLVACDTKLNAGRLLACYAIKKRVKKKKDEHEKDVFYDDLLRVRVHGRVTGIW